MPVASPESDSPDWRSSMLQPLEVPSAYEHVAERLRRHIWLGHTLPGDRLPPERTLADALGVSRVTIREALRVLQGEGLITTSRGSKGGTIISDPPVSQQERAKQLLRSEDQLNNVHEVRLAVEPMAARLAAEHATDAQVKHLERTHESLYSSDNVAAFRQADSAFHIGLAQICGNPYLANIVEDARARMFLPLDVVDFHLQHGTSGRAHANVLTAIRDHDPDAAARLMEDHLYQARDEVISAVNRLLTTSALKGQAATDTGN